MEPQAPIMIRGADAQAYAEQLRRDRQRRLRWRLAFLAGFLILGLSLGTIWATGFASTGGTTGTTGPSPPLTSTPGDAQDTSGLNALLTSSGNLTYNFNGRNGSVVGQVMYTVDLTGEPGGNNYFTGVFLTNSPIGFSDLQLEVRIAVDGANNTCEVADLTGTATSNYRVFVMDTNDAQVTFSGMGGATTGLPGAERYCIGVVSGGGDPNGTMIRKVTSNTNPTYPTFVASLNQMP